jgi:hypothetical protein
MSGMEINGGNVVYRYKMFDTWGQAAPAVLDFAGR